MKTLILSLLALAPAAAFAHGSAAHQAAEAVEAATALFDKTQSREVRKMFHSVLAVRGEGYEEFDVTVALTNRSDFKYFCKENEDVDPVVWECKAK